MEFRRLCRVEEALKNLIERLKMVEKEIVSIYECYSRILAEDVYAKIDVPPFDRAAMDGYALKAEDTFGADEEKPVKMKIVGKIEAGEIPNFEIKSGEAAEISTGAAIPRGANAVVMVENTRKFGDHVEVFQPLPPFKNISFAGEDVKAGDLILRRGEILQPQDAGILAACGIKEVNVFRKPKVAIISTGNELVEVGSKLEYGKIYCSNAAMLVNALREFAEPLFLGIVPDDRRKIESVLEEALKFDAVIFTGGTSVGKKDVVSKVVENLAEIVFHGVAMKPGMPSGAAVFDGKPIFMLPGSPVAAFLAYKTFAEPSILAMMGVRLIARRSCRVRGVLRSPVVSQIGTKSYVRVFWDGKNIEPVRISGSSIMSSMVRANGLLIVPENVEGYDSGEEVEIELIRDVTVVIK